MQRICSSLRKQERRGKNLRRNDEKDKLREKKKKGLGLNRSLEEKGTLEGK